MTVDRERYQSSGQFHPLLMFVALVISCPLAVLAGYAVFQAFISGHDWLFIPLACSLLVTMAVAITVRLGRCRNRLMGGLAGITLSLLAVVSLYQIDFASRIGYEHLHRLDALPDYVEFRQLTRWDGMLARMPIPMAERDDPAEAVRRANGMAQLILGPPTVRDWLDLALIAAGLGVMPVIVGVQLAGNPYSEAHGRWMESRTLYLTPEKAADFSQAVKSGDLEQLALACEPTAQRVVRDSGVLTIYYLPYEPDAPMFAHLAVRKGAFSFSSQTGTLLPSVILEPDEGAVVSRMLKLHGVKPAAAAQQEGAYPAPLVRRADSGAVIDLPDDRAARVLTRSAVIPVILISALPMVIALLIAVLLGVAAYLHHDDWGDLGVAATVVAGLIALVVGFKLTVRREEAVADGIIIRRLARAIRERPDPAVDPDDPDVIYVAVIPREHWGKFMMISCWDIGFLKIDTNKRMLRFEGAKQRWAIPAGAISGVRVEEFCIGVLDANEYNVHAVAVVSAQIGGEPWEAPLALAHQEYVRPNGEYRRRHAGELAERIREFIGHTNVY